MDALSERIAAQQPAEMATPAGREPTARNRELDGIRGWAALAVICQHLVINTFASYVPALNLLPRTFHDGSFAVLIFFVLSGDALTARFLQTGELGSIRKLALTRYFRLEGLILFSCALMFALAAAGLAPHREAAALIGNSEWFGTSLDFPLSLPSMLWYALVKVYREFGWTQEDSYNPFLWTMSIELLGSFLLFAYCFVLAGLRRRVWPTVAVMLLSVFVNDYAPAFFLGMLVGMARSRGIFDRQLQDRRWQIASLLIVAVILVADSIGQEMGYALRGLLGAALIWCVGSNVILKRALTAPLSRFLGRISFPLYAMQFVVVMSPTALALVTLQNAGWLNTQTALATMAGSFVLMIVLAWLVAAAEQRYLAFLSRAADRLLQSAR